MPGNKLEKISTTTQAEQMTILLKNYLLDELKLDSNSLPNSIEDEEFSTIKVKIQGKFTHADKISDAFLLDFFVGLRQGLIEK